MNESLQAKALQQPIALSLYLYNFELAWFTDGLKLTSRQISKTTVTF